MKARRWLAALLAGTMVLGSVASVSAETLSGTSWWGDNDGYYQVGKHTAVTGDGTWSYTIHADELIDGYGAFVVEMFDNADENENTTESSRYLTTTSDRSSWTANDPVGSFDALSDSSLGLSDGGNYVVEITRDGQDFTVEYYILTDATNAERFYVVTFTESDFDETVYWRVMGQVGTFTVSDLTSGHVVTDDSSITVTNKVKKTTGDYTGTSWWEDYAVSDDTVLSGNGTWTYLIDMINIDNGCDYVVEVSDSTNTYYITTTDNKDAWTYAPEGDDAVLGEISSEGDGGYSYYNYMQCAVEITRNDTEFVFNYYALTDSAAILFLTYTVTGAEAFGTDVYARFMAQVGSYDLTVYNGSYVTDKGLSLVNLITGEWSAIEGTDGELTWKVDNEGTLTITGEGDYDSSTSYRAWYPYRVIVKKAVVDVAEITSTAGMFSGMGNLTEVDVSSLDTSKVTDMNGMFGGCSSLTSLDVSGWDTSNVESMQSLFSGCSLLTTIDVSSWDTSNVYEMSHMFQNCESLTSLDVTGFDTSNVEYFGDMFSYCFKLTDLDISSWDTSKAINIDYMFAYCTSLTTLNVGNLNTSRAELMTGMFEGCSSLTSIDVSNWDTSNVEFMGYMFWGCSSLTTLDVSKWNTSKVANMDNMFWGCTGLTLLKVPASFGYYSEVYDEETDTSTSTWMAITLPSVSGYYWANANAKTVTEIDPDLSSQMWYIRYANGTTAEINYMGIAQDISKATITLSATSYTYDGTAKAPTVSSVVYSGDTLIQGTDYTVSYSNNTNAGTATVTITGIGDFAGSKASETFTISKASQSISVSSSSVSLAVGGTSTVTVSGAKTAVSYSSSNTSVATVSSSGVITAKGVGTATITVTAAAGTNYNQAAKTVSVTVKPAATTISSVANTTSGVKITWKKVTGATGYYVYRSTSKNGTYTKIATITSGSTVTYTNKSSGTYKVTSGKTYYYKVSAYASTGTAAKSSAKSVKYLTAGKIKSLTNTTSGITVKWSKVSGASGYYVYRKTSTGSYKKVKTIKSASTVSYTDTAVKSKNGTTYTYKVVPYSGSNTGSFTAKKTVRMTAVSLSSVKNSSSKKMTVKWKKNSKATGYQIQYSTSKSFASGNKTETVSKAASTSKVISSLKKGKTYYVRIRTYKTVSGTKYYSAWSSKKSVKISK